MHSRKQKGFSLLGMIFWGGIFGVLFVVGAQISPTVFEYMAILKASNKAAIEATSVPDVRAIFDRTAAIDNIDSVAGRDLQVTKEGDKIVVSFAYNREIHLVGPAYLVLKYAGRSK